MSVRVLISFSTRFLAALIVAALCATGAYGRNIEVDWTPEGARPYRNYRTPLRTELGDNLILRCGREVSNLFIQTHQIQYETCNATAGSGMFDYNGFCLRGGTLRLTLTKNSQSLMNTVNFVNNSVYYLTSYSNDILSDADDPNINSGGQCEQGIRMIIVIGEVAPSSLPTPPSTAPIPDISQVPIVSDGNEEDTDRKLLVAIAPAVAGAVVVILLVITFITLLIKGFIVCYCSKSNKVHGDPLSHHVAVNMDPATQDKGFYSLVKVNDERGTPSPTHGQTQIVGENLRTIRPVQHNYYVDSPHLPVSRTSSQQSDEDDQQELQQNDQKDYINSPSLSTPEHDDEQEVCYNQRVNNPSRLPVSKPLPQHGDHAQQLQRDHCVESPVNFPVSRLSSQHSSEVTVQRSYYVDSHNLPSWSPRGDRVQQLRRNFCVDTPPSLPPSTCLSCPEQQVNHPYNLDSSSSLSVSTLLSQQSDDVQQVLRNFCVDSPSLHDLRLPPQPSDKPRPYNKTVQQNEPIEVTRTSYNSERSSPAPVVPSKIFKTIDEHEESLPLTFNPGMQAWRII